MAPEGGPGLLDPLFTAEGVVFALVALGIVAMSILCMTRRNPVTAVMSLVATFFGLAAVYATLSAHFLAVLQVLVYAGAIMVLFVFVVMILNREETTLISWRGLPTRVLGVLAGAYLVWVFFEAVTPDQASMLAPPRAVPDSFGTVASVGDVLFRQFVFPFEAISLLLLVAITGGVVVSRSHRKEVDAIDAAQKRIATSRMAGHDFPGEAGGVAAGHGHGHGDHGGGGGGGHH
jgi:NADH-quinone oxidoreductase subunit J